MTYDRTAHLAPLDLARSWPVIRNGECRSLPLSSVVGSLTLLSLHLKSGTTSCSKQVRQLVEHRQELQRLGISILAGSRDRPSAQLRYAVRESIPFPVLADPDDHLFNALGAVATRTLYGRSYTGPARAAFLIDGKGKVLLSVLPLSAEDFIHPFLEFGNRQATR